MEKIEKIENIQTILPMTHPFALEDVVLRNDEDIEELTQEETKLRESLDQAKDNVQKAMVAEYQSFYERVMKSALAQAERKVAGEKSEIIKQRDENEKELIVVQTQIKRLIDENNTLRTRLGDETTETADGRYDL